MRNICVEKKVVIKQQICISSYSPIRYPEDLFTENVKLAFW